MIAATRPTRALSPEFLLRLGLGLIFLTNALTAWFYPSEFRDLLAASYLHTLIGNTDWFTNVIATNDTLLFLMILSGKWRRNVAIWASLWILGVMVVTGVVTPDFVEHLGVLALIAAYVSPAI